MAQFEIIENTYEEELTRLEALKDIDYPSINIRIETIEEQAMLTAFRKTGVNITKFFAYALLNYHSVLELMVNDETPDYVKEYLKTTNV